jgi:SAM-dependent methyltransferase
VGSIDLCSGDGWFTLSIAKTAHKVFAIDLDGNLLETAKHRLAESRISNCLFIEGDAYKLAEFVPEPVDCVFLANAFHGVPDKARLSIAVRAALKPDGLFAIVNWYDRPREETLVLGEPRGPQTELRMSPEATIAAVQQGGLGLRYVVDVSPYHYGAVFSRPVALATPSAA